MILHLLNRSPATGGTVDDALAAMGPDDRLLLIEDGVLGALPAQVARFTGLTGRLFALREDLAARGLLERCEEQANIVDVDGFVTLTEEADKTVSWS
ncbi:tRNA 2-thiouridine synthesizing protein B [Onishia taeanensis]|uniref:tRNA 2-thiouridine synthesizing protein B n=1 Tax=Onishia taeanensis TaxID=284577 RepID=A0A1G7Q8B5_9GAMM|nr:sulfurtransferase complex subunit TusB [Halomonas taeanensis]SDF94827.1 tRNA 2-thiouridine synthesizing protein B [Halomonas taeanensis]